MKNFRGAVTLSGGLFLAGCVTTKPLVEVRDLPGREVVRLAEERSFSVHTVSGDGSLTIEGPEESGTLSFQASLRKPDSLLIDLHGPFGIRVGTLLLSRSRFTFHNWREHTTTVGAPDGVTLYSLFHLNLRFQEVLDAFTGDFLPDTGDSLEHSSVVERQYVLVYRTASGTREFRVDPENYAVTSYRLIDKAGKPSIVAIASRFELVGGRPVPRLLRVIFPKERRSLTVAYGDIRLNEEVNCTFVPPADAVVIER